jgi:hypothetical protein
VKNLQLSKVVMSPEIPAKQGRLERKRQEAKQRAEAKRLTAKRQQLAAKLQPLMAGLDGAGPFVESCPHCHQALLPELGRCNIFHDEDEFKRVKSRFVKESQLSRRGWSIPKSQGGIQRVIKRFLGEPVAFVPKNFASNLFDAADRIPLYSKADVEAVETSIEFRACIGNSHKADSEQAAKRD